MENEMPEKCQENLKMIFKLHNRIKKENNNVKYPERLIIRMSFNL